MSTFPNTLTSEKTQNQTSFDKHVESFMPRNRRNSEI